MVIRIGLTPPNPPQGRTITVVKVELEFVMLNQVQVETCQETQITNAYKQLLHWAHWSSPNPYHFPLQIQTYTFRWFR